MRLAGRNRVHGGLRTRSAILVDRGLRVGRALRQVHRAVDVVRSWSDFSCMVMCV